jgi:hypothetical protein
MAPTMHGNDPPPNDVAPLSLQDKLDRISHERKVLAALRDLARHGLQEGDAVKHRTSGAQGRVVVVRSAVEPQAIVRLDDGTQALYSAEAWIRPTP